MEPLRVLVEETDHPGVGLPPQLARLYGGDLRLAPDLLYANLISSLDGVVALAGPVGALRGDCTADRLVMAVLRAAADAVVIGASTLRASGRHQWTAPFIDPERADVYSAWRGDPQLAVVTASGAIDPGQPALRNALVLTTESGAARLRGHLAPGSRLVSLGAAPSGGRILEALRAEGHRRILTEGGPTLLGRFVAEGLLDELFLTLSPGIAGRRRGDGRLGLVEGVELLPGDPRWGRLLSLRAQGSCLYARYAFGPPRPSSGPPSSGG